MRSTHPPRPPQRRRLLRALAAAPLAAAVAPFAPLAQAAAPTTGGQPVAANAGDIQVWKDPQCGCCNDWIAHLRDAGFRVTAHDGGRHAVRAKMGLPDALASCHTAVVQGYAIEGHVPAADIRRLLRERPTAVGLAVPGMPVGSPGMDGPAYNGRQDPYDTLLVGRDGRASVYQSHR